MRFYQVMTIVLTLSLFFIFLLLMAGEALADQDAITTIAYEASDQSLSGQVSVASVIKTRMYERNKTASQVVFQPYQFSCWHPKTHEPTQLRVLSKIELKMAERAWKVAKKGIYNHYARHDIKPYWIKSAKRRKRIGDHIFYEL